MKKIIVVSMVLLALLITCVTPATAQAPIKITAKQLYEEYEANEIASDLKYKDKLLEVTGFIENFSKETFSGKSTIHLEAGFLAPIWAHLSPDQVSTAATLTKGDKISVVGTCKGKPFICVELEDCYIAKVYPPEPEAPPTSPTTPKPEKDKDEGCFIATAAYGTDTAQEIDILREFRDEILLPNSLGARFVSVYYRTSPPIADFISQWDVLRTIVRVGFVNPIVAILNFSHSLWSE